MNIKLSDGKEINAPNGVIGIDDKGCVFGGYDSTIFERGFYYPFDEAPDLTPIEQIEIADLMISRWKSFKAAAESEKCATKEAT
jgi:hypothetical protein